MKLPNPEQALIPFEKLEGYSLNPNHAEGRHKAVVFAIRTQYWGGRSR
ncbi:hypothetical protein Q2T42_15810 [Leptolyngbya boryana CZ1]|uniref:DUF6883 domain-containing protein n=1 Tax=Leptolyngbya boryana CZ1 TaxID=3060204 RepID=A0AA96WND0_LEPBY|nr:DUF6883 domain-containing protein [Leptolyngbya boryana]WNZ43321.1 hypothetical protein Q2T42_15810 [Leptolyngbya boryana CZ1]